MARDDEADRGALETNSGEYRNLLGLPVGLSRIIVKGSLKIQVQKVKTDMDGLETNLRAICLFWSAVFLRIKSVFKFEQVGAENGRYRMEGVLKK